MITVQLVISTAMGTPSAWFEDLVIQERFRGQGVGKKLLDKAREWANEKGAKRIQLLADADNSPALKFYQHVGLQPTRLFAWKQQIE
jgi:GNAT superfamily N-acetyltransferase